VNKFGIALVCVCISDLIFTAVGLEMGWFEELNPLFEWAIVRWGTLGFIVTKLFFIVVPVAMIEILTRHYDMARRKISNYYKFTICAYIFILGTGILIQFI